MVEARGCSKPLGVLVGPEAGRSTLLKVKSRPVVGDMVEVWKDFSQVYKPRFVNASYHPFIPIIILTSHSGVMPC